MPSKLSFILCSFLSYFLYVSPAFSSDTIQVKVHNEVDMVWYESYDRSAHFPIEGKEFHKVLMEVTLGCASGGCSDWDYTVNIHLLKELGADSVIVGIDTLAGGILDTLWEVQFPEEEFELGRLITPYAGYMARGTNGFDNNWQHRYVYDVSDFIHLFQDTTTIRAFYAGWSAGFSISTKFHFIEGKPNREVLGVQNITHGSFNYTNPDIFNEQHTPAVSLEVPEGTVEAKLRFLPSGHGFDNNVNCAEFCPRQYFLSVDGDQVANGMIWKDDCGLNPIHPQGGTWVYNRANWCPGEAVPLHEYELGDLLTPGSDHLFDLDLQSYSWNGSQVPSYILSYQVVFYSEKTIQKDAELVGIMAPSTHEDYSRINPICSEPIVKIRNNGAETIDELVIEYGFPEGYSCTYVWTGTLGFEESVEIDLPALQWSEMDSDKPRFYARIMEVNGDVDEVEYNNELESTIEIPEEFPPVMAVNFRTNSRFDDFTYGIYREDHSPVFERNPNAPNRTFSDTVSLSPGCYYFEVWDDQGFGLADWPTGQGNGQIAFRRSFGNFFTSFKTLPLDFGSHQRINFTVGYELDEEPDRGGCGLPVSTVEIPENPSGLVLFPNPTKGSLQLSTKNGELIETIRLTGIDGREVYFNNRVNAGEYLLEMDPSLSSGVYVVEIQTNKGKLREKLVLQR